MSLCVSGVRPRSGRIRSYARGLWRARRRGADEHGAVLVIVAGCLVLFLGLLAYTIDLGSGRQGQQKAQVAADAGAEAGANAIGQGSTPAAAALVATNIATTNDPGSTVSVVNPTGTAVTVNVSDASAGYFSSSKREDSSAVATPGQTTTSSTGTVTNYSTSTTSGCTSAGGGCLAVYAAGTSCGNDSTESSDPIAIQVINNGQTQTSGGVTINGGMWSNGSIYIGQGGSSFGPLTYASGCSISPTLDSNGKTVSPPEYEQNSNTFNNGYPVAATPQTTWPLNYAADFPSCSGTGCGGPSGTPSSCTQASTASTWTINTYDQPFLQAGQVYCAVGSGTSSNPSTWTGTISVGGGGSTYDSSFIAASITVGGGTTLTACGYRLSGYDSSTCSAPAPAATPNYPLFYAVSGTLDDSSGGNTLTGDWFAPNGSIFVGGGTNFVGFLQAQTVDLWGGIQGDGPVDNGSTYGSTSTATSTTVTTTSKVISQGSHLTG